MPKPGAGASFDFRIYETEEFLETLEGLTPQEAKFLKQKFRTYVYPQLRKNPFLGLNIKKLRGYSPETWRYRIGNYRAFYLVDETLRVVFLMSVDKRKDAYR